MSKKKKFPELFFPRIRVSELLNNLYYILVNKEWDKADKNGVRWIKLV